MASLLIKIILGSKEFKKLRRGNKAYVNVCVFSLGLLLIFGKNVHVYLDRTDDHNEFLIRNTIGWMDDFDKAFWGKRNPLYMERQ